ncbi:hypothetical protein KW419_12695 [Vibrio fluvialis]|nr:hypothetical protein [Vibrio fluvialis]MBY7899914.1 hypothetical protein [Vibrio fluvialis]MBY7938605.1 hypothetical protein [Vibrio fluvialis]
MELQEEYREYVLAHLNSLNEIFETELSSWENRDYSVEVKFLQIEYDSPCFSEEFSVCIYALNKDGGLIGDVHWFLKGVAVVVPAEIYEDEKFEDIEPWSTASEVLELWVMDRWQKAGMRKYPCYLAHHDSYFMRNVIDGSQTNWDKIIEAANG